MIALYFPISNGEDALAASSETPGPASSRSKEGYGEVVLFHVREGAHDE